MRFERQLEVAIGRVVRVGGSNKPGEKVPGRPASAREQQIHDAWLIERCRRRREKIQLL
jgi:hypothetical protein